MYRFTNDNWCKISTLHSTCVTVVCLPHRYCIICHCVQILLEWINDELADHRIIVKDIEEDLFDGQILQNLLGEGLDEKERLK